MLFRVRYQLLNFSSYARTRNSSLRFGQRYDEDNCSRHLLDYLFFQSVWWTPIANLSPCFDCRYQIEHFVWKWISLSLRARLKELSCAKTILSYSRCNTDSSFQRGLRRIRFKIDQWVVYLFLDPLPTVEILLVQRHLNKPFVVVLKWSYGQPHPVLWS